MLAELDRWSKLNLPIWITEYDIEVSDPELRADFTRDFLTVCFSHPSMGGVMTWGFWEKAHWKPFAALYDADWNPTSMGEAWNNLVNEQWHTEASVQTDESGAFTVDGFFGDYEIRIGSQVAEAMHQSDGNIVEVVIQK